MKPMLSACAAAALLAASALPANANVTLYADPLTATGNHNLNGTTPATVNGVDGATAGATWSAADSLSSAIGYFDTNGTVFGSTEGAQASLPFTPTAGDIYELSATLEVQKGLGGGQTGLSVGFGAGGNDYQTYLAQAYLAPTSTTLGVNERAYANTTYLAESGAVTLTLDLDTTNAADWTVAAYANSTLISSYDNVSQTISAIDFTNFGHTNGTLHDVSLVDLTDTGTSSGTSGTTGSGTDVPEPASLAILSIGAIGLIATRRRASARR